MRKLLVLLLMAIPLTMAPVYLASEEPAEAPAEAVEEMPTEVSSDASSEDSAPAEESKEEGGVPAWVTILGTILTVVITFLGGFLKKKWGAEETKAKIDTTKSLMEQKNFIIDNRLIPFAISTAEHWLLTQMMPIIKDATDGNGFQWKDHFDSLKKYVKTRVLKKFASENVELIEQLGERELDNLLDRILTKLITKLPDNVQAFLPDSVKNMLSDKASEFLVDKGKDLLGVD